MLINSEFIIAVKDNYGQYYLKDFSIFNIQFLNNCFTTFNFALNKKKKITIKAKCPICDGTHYYKYSISDILNGNVLVGGCESFGIPLFYIGNYEDVINIVKRYNVMNKSLLAMI